MCAADLPVRPLRDFKVPPTDTVLVIRENIVDIYSSNLQTTRFQPDYDLAKDVIECRRGEMVVYIIPTSGVPESKQFQEPELKRITREVFPLTSVRYSNEDAIVVMKGTTDIELFAQTGDIFRTPNYGDYGGVTDGVVCTDGQGNIYICAT